MDTILSILIITATFLFINYRSKRNIVDEYEGEGDYVILLHGIARSYKSMDDIAKYLNKKGYHTIAIDYRSCKYSIDNLVDNFLISEIDRRCKDKDKKIHFVGYSMGGTINKISSR